LPSSAAAFARLAEYVTARTSELLSSHISVIDSAGVVVASTTPALIGEHLADYSLPGGALAHVPIRLHGEEGEVIVGESQNGEVISPRLAEAAVALVVDQSAALARLNEQHEVRNKFIHDLLRAPSGDDADILREGQILGMDFSRPRAVILIDAAEYILPGPGAEWRESVIQRRAGHVIDSVVRFFSLPNATICAYIGNGEVAVLKASTSQDLAPWNDGGARGEALSPSWANLVALKRAAAALLLRLRRDTHASVSIGIGRYHPGVRGLARSYGDARAALLLGRRFRGHNQLHCLDSLGVAAFVGVTDEQTKIELATHLLSPLDQEPDLLETLDRFFAENCSPSSTARQIVIHRNTLSYRLDKIASLTGLDPRRFDDAVQIRLALILRALRSTGDAVAPSEAPERIRAVS
jgi:carbohydrate diacid regulator